MSESLNDKAVRMLANVAACERMLANVNDIGEATGFCDEHGQIVNDAHDLLGGLNARAHRLQKRFERQQKADASALSLEKQYAESLGRMAQLCDTVIPWLHGAMSGIPDADVPVEIKSGIAEIMSYVDSVRP